MQFNTLGQAIGPNAAHFAHILGSTLRHSNIVSLQAEGWWKVSKEEKDKLWKEITVNKNYYYCILMVFLWL